MKPGPHTRLRVLLAEDHLIFRESVRLLLEAEGDIEVAGEAVSGQEAIAFVQQEPVDVVLMDLSLEGLDGIEATKKIREAAPRTQVVMLSANTELHRVRSAIDSGAIGYLTKRARGQELRAAVRAAAAGETHFSEDVPSHLLVGTRRTRQLLRRTSKDPSLALTKREYEILQLIAQGFSNNQVAETLALRVKTVDTHRLNLMRKLRVHNVAELTAAAVRLGIVDS